MKSLLFLFFCILCHTTNGKIMKTEDGNDILSLENMVPMASSVNENERVHFKIDVPQSGLSSLNVDFQFEPNLVEFGNPVIAKIGVSKQKPPYDKFEYVLDRYFRHSSKTINEELGSIYFITVIGEVGNTTNFLLTASYSKNCVIKLTNGNQISTRGNNQPCIEYDGKGIDGLIVSVTPVVLHTALTIQSTDDIHSITTEVFENILFLTREDLLNITGLPSVPNTWHITVGSYPPSKFTPEYEVAVQAFGEEGRLVTGVARYSAVGSNNFTYFFYPKESIFSWDRYSCCVASLYVGDDKTCFDVFAYQNDTASDNFHHKNNYTWSGRTKPLWNYVTIILDDIDPNQDLHVFVKPCSRSETGKVENFVIELIAKSQPLLLIVESQRILYYEFVSKVMFHTSNSEMDYFELQLDSCNDIHLETTTIHMQELGKTSFEVDSDITKEGFSRVFTRDDPLSQLTNYFLSIESEPLFSFSLWISTNKENGKPDSQGEIECIFDDETDCEGFFCNVTLSVKSDWRKLGSYRYELFHMPVPKLGDSEDPKEQDKVLRNHNMHTVCGLRSAAVNEKISYDYVMDLEYIEEKYFARRTILVDRRYDYLFGVIVTNTNVDFSSAITPKYVTTNTRARSKEIEAENRFKKLYDTVYNDKTDRRTGLLLCIAVGVLGIVLILCCFCCAFFESSMGFGCCVISFGSWFVLTSQKVVTGTWESITGKKVMVLTLDGNDILQESEEFERENLSEEEKDELGKYGSL